MSVDDLLAFFHNEQKDPSVKAEDCESIVRRYSVNSTLKVAQVPRRNFFCLLFTSKPSLCFFPCLTKKKFVEFLHSNENSIWNPLHDTIHQDMTHPLAHYFISSSHNTCVFFFFI